MREILFRGKRKDCGSWAEGFHVMYSTSIEYPYSYTNGKHYIQTVPHNIAYEVDPETVCQYTGLTDKNGRKIYEWDIVKDVNGYVGIVRYGKYRNTFNDDEFGGHVGFYIDWREEIHLHRKDLVYWAKNSEFIGNIFDNPELVERGKVNDQ